MRERFRNNPLSTKKKVDSIAKYAYLQVALDRNYCNNLDTE